MPTCSEIERKLLDEFRRGNISKETRLAFYNEAITSQMIDRGVRLKINLNRAQQAWDDYWADEVPGPTGTVEWSAFWDMIVNRARALMADGANHESK